MLKVNHTIGPQKFPEDAPKYCLGNCNGLELVIDQF